MFILNVQNKAKQDKNSIRSIDLHKSLSRVGKVSSVRYNSCDIPIYLQTIYVPADDLTDPDAATTFGPLDARTVLSRAIAELGIYPAVDPLESTSRIMDPNIVGAEHYDVSRAVQKILQVRLMLD